MALPKIHIDFHLRQGYILLTVPYLQVAGMALFPYISSEKQSLENISQP
jgi:hypothetical protein